MSIRHKELNQIVGLHEPECVNYTEGFKIDLRYIGGQVDLRLEKQGWKQYRHVRKEIGQRAHCNELKRKENTKHERQTLQKVDVIRDIGKVGKRTGNKLFDKQLMHR